MDNTQVEIIVKATQQGFDAVGKAINELGANLAKAFEKTPAQVGRLNAETVKVSESINKLTESVTQLNQRMSDEKPIGVFRNMSWSIKSIVSDMEKLIAIQVRWYATRLILWETADALRQVATETFKYAAAIDQARGEMLRWEASSGGLSATVIKDTEGILKAIRMATTEYPVKMEELSKAVQAFVGAGLPYDMIKDMVSSVAALKTGFPEINFEQFAVAATGAYNVFKDSIKGVTTEAEKMKVIFDSISAAQATGIIRPEQFPKVLAYLAQVTKLAGFSLNEMLALSVAVTDTAIAASSASRLIGGVLQNIQKEKFAEQLKIRFGLEIDPNVQIEKQFLAIFTKIRDKIGGVVTPAWSRVFESMGIPADRLRVFETLVERVDKFADVLKKLEGAKGGVDLAAEVAKAPVGKQWEVFVNILRELSKESLDTLPIMQSFMSSLVDIGRGFLSAADSSGKYSEQFKNLGTYGQIAYNVYKALAPVIQDFWKAFSDLASIVAFSLKGWIQLIGLLAEFKEIVRVLADIYLAKLYASLIKIVTTGVAAYLMQITASLANWAKALPPILVTNKTMGELVAKTEAWGTRLTALSTFFATTLPIALGVGIFAINKFFDTLNKRFDEIEAAQNRAAQKFKNLVDAAKTSAEASSTITKITADMATLQSQIDKGVLTKNPLTGAEGVTKLTGKQLELAKAQLVELNFQLGLAKKRYRELITEEKTAKPEPKITIPPLVPDKTQVTHVISDVSKKFKDLISESRMNTDALIRDAETAFSTGSMGAEEYYDKVAGYAEKGWEEETKHIDKWELELKNSYARMAGEIASRYKDKPAVSAKMLEEARKAEEADMEDINKARFAAKKKADDEERKGFVTSRKALATAAIDIAREEAKATEFIREESLKDFKSYVKIREDILVDSYNRGLLSAGEYYDELEKIYDEDTQAQKEKLRLDYEALLKLLNDEQAKLNETKQFAAANEVGKRIIKATRDYLADVNALERRAMEEGIEIQIERANSYAAILEGDNGIVGVWNKALEKMSLSFLNWGEQLGWLFEDVVKNLADAFETFFVDIFEGNLKKASDYFRSFTEAVYKSMAKILAQQVAMNAVMGLSGLGKLAGSYIGGMFGGNTTTTLPSTAGVGIIAHKGGLIPEFHVGGMMNDERIAKVKVGERVLSQEQNKMFETMYSRISQSGSGNVEFNLYNQSSQQVTGTAKPPQFDGEKWVINAVIKDYVSGGPTRQIMGGR